VTLPGVIEGSRGIKIVPDVILETIMDNEFDLICLSGGQPSTNKLKNEQRIIKLLQKMQEQGKYISAIWAAPTVLQKAGIIMTCHPSVKLKFDSYTDDGKVITSQSSGTAMELALKFVEILFGVDRMKKVNAGVLARI
jgi:protein deglycase